MASVRPTCQICGAPARVHVSDPLPGSDGSLSHYCLACADSVEASAATPPRSRSATGDSVVLMLVGMVIAFISLFADALPLGGSNGFGRHQWIGVALSGLVLLCGAAMRAPVLLVVGAVIGGLSLGADYLRADGAEFGAVQRAGLLLGVALLAAGGLRLSRQRRQPAGQLT